MMKKIIFFLITGFVIQLKLNAQATYAELENNKVMYPSPTAASLGKYGEFPVSLSSGLVNIGQDIVTVKSGHLSLNVSLSYHASGNRPSDVPGWVGLGFSLNAGGVITRTVRDLPDDYLYGFYFSNDAVQYQWDTYPTTHFVENYYSGQIDPRSDAYQFNFCGKTGEFFFDLDRKVYFKQKTPFKVEIGNLVDGFSAFIITAEDGTVYTFSQTERSQPNLTGIMGSSAASTAWYLTKIKNLSGDSIILKYVNESNMFRYTTYSSRKEVSGYMSDPGAPGNTLMTGATVNANTHSHEVVYLDEIDFSGGKLLFNKSRRYDPIYKPTGIDTSKSVEKKLDLITLKDMDDNVVKKWKFEYIENSTERLKLKNLIVQASDEANVQKYSFGYDLTHLPVPAPGPSAIDPYFTNDVDYWGYYNGFANGDNKIPKQYNATHNAWLGTANRSVNPVLATCEMLDTIYYPTGGYTAFQYESNDYSSQGDSYAINQNPLHESETDLTQSFEMHYRRDDGGFETDPSTMSFTLADSTHIYIQYSCGADGPQHAWATPGTTYEYDYWAAAGTYTVASILHTADLLTSSNADVTAAHGFVTAYIQGPQVPINAKAGPGVRIKSIVTSDGISTTTKSFEYREANHVVSTGFLSVFPAFQADLESFASNIFGTYISSDPINDIGEGAPIGYSRVVEHFQDSSYVVHNYTAGVPDDWNSFTSYSSDYKLAHMSSNDCWRGLEWKTEYYNASGIKQKEVINYYDTLVGSLANVLAIELKPTVTITDFSSGPNNVNGTLTTVYQNRSVFLYNSGRSEEVFDKNGVNPVSTSEGKDYDNLKHLQPTRIRKVASDGSIVTTAISYPDDYETGVSFIDYMQANHLVSFPIEQVVYKEKAGAIKIVAGSIITYKAEGAGLPYQLFALETSAPIPYTGFKFSNRPTGILPPASSPAGFSADSRYQTALTYLQYDSRGNLLESVKRNGIKTAYLWGYNQQLPVAEIVGSDYATAYGKLTSPSIVDNPVSDDALLTELDKIRTGLPGAMVKTYSYIPLIGMTSQVDITGRKIYYEYDTFGRLKLIRDHNNAILKKVDYKYNGQ